MIHTKDTEIICPTCSARLEDNNAIPYPRVMSSGELGDQFKQIRFCSHCGIGVAYPDVNDMMLTQYYAKGGFWTAPKPHSLFRQAIIPSLLATSRWGSIEEALRYSHINAKIRVLDIGAGYGFIGLCAARSAKFKLSLYSCVEPDFRMRDYLSSIWERHSRKGALEIKSSLEEVSGKFEVVVLSHVLEHVKDPVCMIRKAVSLLSENGIVLIDVPNRDYSFKKDVFPHLVFFDQKSLEYIIRQKGLLSIESIFTYGKDANRSPLNKNPQLSVLVTSFIFKIGKRILPKKILSFLLKRHYGIDRINPYGTWLRAIARKLPGSI